MKRRTLLEALCAGAFGWPFSVLAQKTGRKPVLAFVGSTAHPSELAGPKPRSDILRVFLRRLIELGWEDGRNILIERHTAEGSLERAQAIFADLAARKVDVITTAGNVGANLMAEEALRATRAIPIVFVGGGADPVARGLVKSLARPGGNATGLTLSLGLEFSLKRLELLKEIAPGIKRVAALTPKADFDSNVERMREGLARLGLTLILAPVENPEDYEQAFATALRGRADALFVSNVSLNFRHRSRIVALAARHRLPAEYFFRDSVEAGGLAAYGVDLHDLSRRSAEYVDRILRGAKPADLPVEQPSKFELTINLKTAKALGLTIPQTVLLRADRVIE